MASITLGFIPVAFTITLSPGPDSFLILYNSLAKGKAFGMATLVGVQIGILCHALLSVAGLSILLHYFPKLFAVLSWAGAFYLAYLGIMMIKSRGIAMYEPLKNDSILTHSITNIKPYIFQGLLCNLLNPKVLILFLTIIPAFIQPTLGSGTLQIFLLTLTLLAFNIPVQYCLVVLSKRIYGYFNSSRIGRYLQWACGTILFLFALTLIIKQIQ